MATKKKLEAKKAKKKAVPVPSSSAGGKSRNRGGRPSLFNKARCAKILAARRKGTPLYLCAAHGGVSYDTLSAWMKQGEADAAAGDDTEFSRFSGALKSAEAQWVVDDLSTIEKASDESWQAAAWRLERLKPEWFGRRVVDVNVRAKDARKVLADTLGVSEDEIPLPVAEGYGSDQ
jgi:hypothetical protein